ncbi:hypothetical protein C5D98_15350 [Rathayibacter rathayi]|nr:hypothetical protein C5C15_09480 [Rathayibacter rathayi]PPI64578.1 hypothetical protein C5D98_15350 [Rathayibacter rathayi]
MVYLGKSSAIDANALEGFTPSDVDELLEAVEGSPRLEEKIRRARDWEPGPDEVDEPKPALLALAEETLSWENSETLGPASDRDAAYYWANLARRMAREIKARMRADDVPVGAVVRSPAGTIACRFDETNGIVFGDERPFLWSNLASPVQVLWSPIGAPVEETTEAGR